MSMLLQTPAVSGVELGYAEATALKTSSSTIQGNDAWAALSITVTVGTRPIIVEAACSAAWNGTLGDGAIMHIYEGATKLATAVVTSSTASAGAPLYCRARLTPTAGSHTYNVKVNALTGGTATFNANTDAFSSPAFIQATEV